MVTRRWLLFLTAFSILAPHSLRAEPKLDVVLSKQKIPLEETAALTIQVEWPRNEAHYTFAFPNLQLNHLAIEQHGESQETFIQDGEEWVRKTFLITLKPDQIGEGKIESFIIHYLDPSTQKGGSFTVPEQSIAVVRARVKISPYLVMTLLSVAVGAIIFALSYFLWPGRFHKAADAADDLSVEQKALNTFRELIDQKGKKTQTDLLHHLSTNLQGFVRNYYKIPAGQITDQELLTELKNQPDLSRQEWDRLQKLFDRLYEARFTGTNLSGKELDDLMKDIIHYIEGKQVVGNP